MTVDLRGPTSQLQVPGKLGRGLASWASYFGTQSYTFGQNQTIKSTHRSCAKEGSSVQM